MPDDRELTGEQEQLYRKARVPHKFCPYCGTRNEAGADACVNCEKDISWMRIPEPVPYDTAPVKPPASLPEGERIFTFRTVIIFVLVLVLIAALVVILALVSSKSEKPESQVRVATLAPATGAPRQCPAAVAVMPGHEG